MNGPNNPIGWCDFTWNPVKGKCPVACPYCYARRIYDRFGYDSTIRLDEKELMAPYKLKKHAKIFVGSMMELFCDDVAGEWRYKILDVVKDNPQHTFQFLTKMPKRMHYIFPDNCWCGVTVEGENAIGRLMLLRDVKADIKFASFEPLHSGLSRCLYDETIGKLDWIIIGAETGNRKGKIKPKKEWIEQIITQADYLGIPVFMKDNLKPYWHGELRQEFPE